MKLVFVTDNGFYEKDGSYYYSAPNYTHVNHLKKYFDEFVFIARRDKYDKSSFSIEESMPVYLFKKLDLYNLNKKLSEVIKTSDIVICYGINGYFARKIAKKLKKTTIVYNGGDVYDFLVSRGTLKGKLLARIARIIEKDKFLHADYAHYCDNFLVDRYPTKGKTFVCSGVSIEINESNLDKRLSNINSHESKKFVIGLIGHTKNNLKGIETAIKAISKLDNRYELQIVGRGEHEKYDRLSEVLGIKNRIKFLGTLKAGDEIFNWLDSVDIYIQPSLIEGLPRATIEAMSRCCPIVSSNAGGLPNLIDEEYRIEFNDYEALAQKIRLLSDSVELRKNQAIRNFEKSKQFSPDIRIEKYDKFYGQILKEI